MMPAYRSDAEAEIRDPVVTRLRELMPGARIIHEIMCATHGDNRIDVLAVSETEIAAVEIKSSKDKLDRLSDQISGMRGCANYPIAALHGKFFEVGHSDRFGRYYSQPREAAGAAVWGFGLDPVPDGGGGLDFSRHELLARWVKPMVGPPTGALAMMWRAELRAILARKRPTVRSSKLDMCQLQDRIRWEMTGQEITREICATLRARQCAEADPAIPLTAPGEDPQP